MRWDLFCRVIDNLGDAGVCWRLAADLAARGEAVRLVIDDAAPLARIAPGGRSGVEVVAWRDDLAPGVDTDVTIEAFGCDPPGRYVEQMARRDRPPCWLNLEYLSAEPHAARSHGLPSPQSSGPGQGLVKWFFQPGFTPDTGGLLREPGLLDAREAFERDAWLQAMGWPRGHDERVVVLFCYPHPGIDAWLQALSAQRILLLVPQGPAQSIVQRCLGSALRLNALRAVLLDWLPQAQFDRLLWSADLNIVRGEDSLVRALWAGAPFVWQLYPQHDGAHRVKLQAFLERWGADGTAAPPRGRGRCVRLVECERQRRRRRAAVDAAGSRGARPSAAGVNNSLRQADLTSRLIGFVTGKR